MSRRIYNVVTQFLIALSVGSLIGDAFLHLIPHALLSHGHSHSHSHEHSDEMSEHDAFVWKSMIILIGIYGFFITERLTILCQNSASKRKLRRNYKLASNQLKASSEEACASSLTAPMANGGSQTNQSSESARCTQTMVHSAQCGSARGSCANRLGGEEIESDMTKASRTGQLCNRPPSRPLDNARCSDFLSGKTGTTSLIVSVSDLQCFDDSGRADAAPGELALLPDLGGVPNRAVSWTLGEGAGDPSSKKTSGDDSEKALVKARSSHEGHSHRHHVHAHGHGHHHHHHGHHFLRPLPHLKKPHGHHHGHSHDLSSVRAIAWTIIAGDGLHNFCDGIAIGASFSESLQGGLSTALAVLCHELPHELGDFAVLLHAGMSVKAALFYNALSSILCTAGMVLGVLLGSLPSVNLWLFLITAGMFVYIALVDMMPELTTNRLGGHRRCHSPSVLFLWQNMGMLIGVAVMLVIAKFETVM
uniref:Zinc transporter ZIP10 n=1 Tax=Mesocestoides corti TaxID=53468 RepID=A0A5K3EFV5_MESCO